MNIINAKDILEKSRDDEESERPFKLFDKKTSKVVRTMETKKKETKKKEISLNFNDLSIKAVDTNKNKLPQRFLMKHNIIPRFPGVCVLVGSIGTGKTTFLHNLLSRPEFYGISYENLEEDEKAKPYFDHIFLMTGSDDDMYDKLVEEKIIKEEHIKFSPKAEDIQKIIDVQKANIDKVGLLKAPRVLIILEDIVDDLKLMRSKALRTLFIKPRQHNFSVIIMAQYLRFIPPGLRRQALNIFIFGGDRKSTEIICEEFCPAKLPQKEFMKLIEQAQEPRPGETHPFLHINKRGKRGEKFRRNLDTVLLFN